MLFLYIVVVLVCAKLVLQLALLLHLHAELLLLDLRGEIASKHLAVVVAPKVVTLNRLLCHLVVTHLADPIQLLQVLGSLNFGLRVIDLVPLSIVLVCNQVLTVDDLLDPLEVSVLVSHEGRHDRVQFFQCHLPVIHVLNVLMV